MLFLLLLACFGPDPEPDELIRLRQNIDHWKEGVAQLERGEAATAVVTLHQARVAADDDLLLMAWEARALAEAGDLPGAVELLDEVLTRRPGFAVARYNRAAYRARLGEAAAAAVDLREAMAAGVRTPREVMRDPDFAAYVGTEVLSFLPSRVVDASLAVSTAEAFVGDEVEVLLTVDRTVEGPVEVTGLMATGPVRLVRVVEEDAVRSDGDRRREIRWTLLVTGAGPVAIGSSRLTHDGETVELETLQVTATGPGEGTPVPARLVLRSPGQVVGEREIPSAWRGPVGAWVVVPPNSHVEVDGRRVSRLRWSLRRDGAVRAELYPLPDDGRVVRVLAFGEELLDVQL